MSYLIDSNFFMYRPIHLNESSIAMSQAYFPGMVGVGSNANPNTAFRESLGEQLERFALYKGDIRTKKNSIVFDFLNFEKKTISNKYLNMVDNVNFLDSTGAANGNDSLMSICHGFYEFVERQSLVFSFLTKEKSWQIDPILVENANIDYLSLKRRFTFLTFNEISIYPPIKVVILIGINNYSNKFIIGLGADKDLNRAILKAYKESMGGNSNVEGTDNTDKVIDKYNGQMYSSTFYKTMTAQKMKKSFDYLINQEQMIHNIKLAESSEISVKDIHRFAKFFNLPVLLVLISNNRVKNTSKTIKFFSLDMYPHINTLIINPKKYKISFFKSQKQLFPNEGKYLPFP